MTKLEAVNEALRWIGQPPVENLDTGGASDEAEAEAELDATLKEVLGRGWFVNTEEEVGFGVPTVKIAVTGVTGTFNYSETVTESVTGATGFYAYTELGVMYINKIPGSPDFTGGHTLTGALGATATGGAYTLVASAKIPYPSNMLSVEPSRTRPELNQAVGVSGFFYDQPNRTFTWQAAIGGLYMRVIKTLQLTDLQEPLAEYVSKAAAMRFLLYKMPGRTDAVQMRETELSLASNKVRQWDGDLRRVNLNRTPEARRLIGDRWLYDNGGPVTGMQNAAP